MAHLCPRKISPLRRMTEKCFGNSRIVLYFCLFSLVWIDHAAEASYRQASTADYRPTYHPEIQFRGGDLYKRQNAEAIELNPEYHNYGPPSPQPSFAAQNEHDIWLQQQQIQKQAYQPTFSRSLSNSNMSLFGRLQHYFNNLYELSPTLVGTNVACVAIFLLWQLIPIVGFPAQKLVHGYFVNSRVNLKHTRGLSLILSAASHESLYHLMANLLTLSHVGPSVAKLVRKRQRYAGGAMWPLLIQSAVASNTIFLLGRPLGSSIGLSGVTMSLMAIQALAAPQKVFSMIIGVFPVSLQARHFLQILLAMSLVGCFLPRSQISHLTHLGGLLFGIAYYELFLVRTGPRYGRLMEVFSR